MMEGLDRLAGDVFSSRFHRDFILFESLSYVGQSTRHQQNMPLMSLVLNRDPLA